MKIILRAALAVAVLATANLAGEPNVAGAANTAVLPERAGTLCEIARPNWAVVRVTVASDGNVEAMRVAYRFADEAFGTRALQAVSQTSFVPLSHVDKHATFDYLVSSDENGKHATRFVESLAASESPAPVRMRVAPGNDAWAAESGRSCMGRT
jgi:TonB family protein